jgi:hypothetical protein
MWYALVHLLLWLCCLLARHRLCLASSTSTSEIIYAHVSKYDVKSVNYSNYEVPHGKSVIIPILAFVSTNPIYEQRLPPPAFILAHRWELMKVGDS